jgi:hypothetical protein
MSIPGFTADAGLYETRNSYRSPAFNGGSSHGVGIIPQLGGRGFKGFAGCQADCMDMHPNFTREQCRRACVDPFGGTDLGTSRSFWDTFLTKIGIDFWELGCTSITGAPVPCGWVADEIRRQS